MALMGPSGSGKSTLLHRIAAMDKATGGEIRVLGHNLRELSDREIAHWRNEHLTMQPKAKGILASAKNSIFLIAC